MSVFVVHDSINIDAEGADLKNFFLKTVQPIIIKKKIKKKEKEKEETWCKLSKSFRKRVDFQTSVEC